MARAKAKTEKAAAGAANGPVGDVLTLAEAAAYLRLPEAEVARLVFDQGLPGRHTGTGWRFLKAALQEWLRAPPPRGSKEALLSVAGAWKDFPDLDEMLEEIYERRGRPMTEGGRMILLDTDILTHYFGGHPRVVERVRSADEAAATTVISRIEVLQGRFDSLLKAADGEQLERARELLERAEAALARITVIPVDAAAAAEFDRLRQNKKLKKIGRRDLLIACIALAHRARLVTRNLRDFRQVPGLQLENWAD